MRAAYHPIYYINEQMFRGDLEADDLKIGICAGFEILPKI
jgi:hypothetical protein